MTNQINTFIIIILNLEAPKIEMIFLLKTMKNISTTRISFFFHLAT